MFSGHSPAPRRRRGQRRSMRRAVTIAIPVALGLLIGIVVVLIVLPAAPAVAGKFSPQRYVTNPGLTCVSSSFAGLTKTTCR